MTEEEKLADELERRRLQEEADLSLGREAFGIGEAAGSGLDTLPLSTKEDFEVFKKTLVARLQSAEKSPHYVPFLEAAFRDICASLDPDDIKRLSSNLNSLFNEKVKALKVGCCSEAVRHGNFPPVVALGSGQKEGQSERCWHQSGTQCARGGRRWRVRRFRRFYVAYIVWTSVIVSLPASVRQERRQTCFFKHKGRTILFL